MILFLVEIGEGRMLVMNRKMVSAITLTLLLTSMWTLAFNIQPVKAGGMVGVKAGDWIKCTYTISGWPSGTPYPEWLKVEFLSVEGTNATIRVTMRMSDGTEQSDTMTLDVAAGGGTFQGLSGFVIPANCTTGDSIYMTGYGNVTIAGETTGTYAGASRTVVYASFSQYGTQLTYYWDKQTGVMVEASVVSGSVTATAKATETNMWQAETIYIRADGSIDPPDAPISTVDNVTYTLTGNITGTTDGIVVERSNIIIDGAGYTVEGSRTEPYKGIYLSGMKNVTIKNVNVKHFYYGIWLASSSNNNSIVGNNITNNNYDGIYLVYSSYNSIAGNNVANNWCGILLSFYSSNNTVSANNVTNNFRWGIDVINSDQNTISGNVVTNNREGIYIETSSQNILRDNNLAGNRHNFGVFAFRFSVRMPGVDWDFFTEEVHLSTFIQDVDTSNTVNGKPIYYLVNQKNLLIDSSDIGYLALINCTNIHVKGLTLTNNGQGLLLAFTTNSTIENATIAHNSVGIHLLSSDANTIAANSISDNEFGISLYRSSSNNITKNTLTNNGYLYDGFYGGGIVIGLAVYSMGTVSWADEIIPSVGNIISSNMMSNNSVGIVLTNPGTTRTIINGNTISKNEEGIYIEFSASNNKIYHNNFIDNKKQVDIFWYGTAVNVWDDGYPSGGNYWSDYVGVDVKSGPGQDLSGSDGIGDAPYIIDANNRDCYPLMNPYGAPPPPTYTLTITTTAGGTTDPAPGTYSYTVNSTLQITAIPNVNYLFKYWELDGVNVGSANPYSVYMDKDHTLKAVFSPIPPPLSVSISPPSASILVGQSVTFTSTVSGGYTPYSYQWYLNGNPVSGATSNTWTFTPTTSGIYYVHLKVTDAKANTAQSDTARIAVATVPVGGYSFSIQVQTKTDPVLPYIALMATLTAIFTKLRPKTKRKR
jgi:parallel beta-helix repeat protein